MSVDLATQIRDYAREVHSDERPLTLDEIMERRFGTEPVRPIGPLPQQAEPRPRRRWSVVLAAAAAVLVLMGGAALLLQVIGTEAPVATTLPSEPQSLSAWARVPNDEAVFGGEGGQGMMSVTAGGPGLVAVGWDELEGVDHRAAVWTSPDGITWSRIPHDPEVFGGELNEVLWSVTAGGPGLVAVGSAEDHVAAVWTSVDGVTWSRVPHDAAVFPGGWIKSVTAGGPGLVAVGTAGDEDVAVVWTSPDGITWSRVPHDPAVFGGEGNQLTMNSVTAGGPGLVAVGEEATGNGWTYAAVWTSPDGVTWSRVPNDEAVFGQTGIQSMSSVTAGPSGLVAVGRAGGDAAVWTSPDGLTWARVPHDEAVFGAREMSSVTVGGPGLVAVGAYRFFVPDAVIWTSADGITWARVPHDESLFNAAEMTSVTSGGLGVVAVGATRPNDDFDLDAAVWVAATED
jgi:hypothetical protein